MQRLARMSGQVFCVEKIVKEKKTTKKQRKNAEKNMDLWAAVVSEFSCTKLNAGACTVDILKFLANKELIKFETVEAVADYFDTINQTFPDATVFRDYSLKCSEKKGLRSRQLLNNDLIAKDLH